MHISRIMHIELNNNTLGQYSQTGVLPKSTRPSHCASLQIAAYGVITTPALVVDGKVVSYGKVLNTSEVVKILQMARR
ncbi:MAG: thioredoxin family protein [Thermoclostridium sp.]|nr:thioredoxin family protein [Thermoclostridium sp.]